MDIKAIKKQAEAVKTARLKLANEEDRLGIVVRQFLGPRGSIRSLARQMDISAGYLCDISNGRRKVSDAVVEKVIGL